MARVPSCARAIFGVDTGRKLHVVYLAFFLPMAIARTILLKSGMITDIGTVSLLTVVSGVVGPVILYGLIQWSGHGQFLFKRPQWAHIDRVTAPREAFASAE
jgi:uncharacterized membrane protein YcfT